MSVPTADTSKHVLKHSQPTHSTMNINAKAPHLNATPFNALAGFNILQALISNQVAF